jgi:hypothetical protein
VIKRGHFFFLVILFLRFFPKETTKKEKFNLNLAKYGRPFVTFIRYLCPNSSLFLHKLSTLFQAKQIWKKTKIGTLLKKQQAKKFSPISASKRRIWTKRRIIESFLKRTV